MSGSAPEESSLSESLNFEGRALSLEPGDTVASALFRAGVRTFSRSFKYHRRRGLYCLTGDCPNCLVTVDGEPGVRACLTPARAGQSVRREVGWPSAERDLLAIADRLHWLLPVGFYYKTLVRPRWLWPRVERIVRASVGLGEAPRATPRVERPASHLHPDVLVVGAGAAGLSAALTAAGAGQSVVVCDEGVPGDLLAPGASRARVETLAAQARAHPRVTLLERAPAIGIYEGPLVPVNAPALLYLVHPGRVVVATGAVQRHGVFPGSDLPGVWLSRGAARLAGAYGVTPGTCALVVGADVEAPGHAETLRVAGADVRAVEHGTVIRAEGRTGIRRALVAAAGAEEEIRCDALVLAFGRVPRAGLLRQGAGLPVVGAGDVVDPGCRLEAAEESGRRAGLNEAAAPGEPSLPVACADGIVCLCEDVSAKDLRDAWTEGFRSVELLKRYTTATMGPCQGALCHEHLRAFVGERLGGDAPAAGAATARPPARGITLEDVASGLGSVVEARTALYARHVEQGAVMEPAGAWRRPERFGDLLDEYWAVRRHVGVSDVGTLGKYLVAGRGALEFLERLYPCYVHDLPEGRLRYTLLLGDHGYVVDDGLVCRLADDRFYLTFTSGGGDQAEAHMRDWADAWGLEVHLVNRTAELGAINIAGPGARALLERLSADSFAGDRFPYLHHREVVVAGVPCRALRLGFVGELSWELHHGSSRSVELWDALLEAGGNLGIQPHGLETLRLLRLEKGHPVVGQDTDFDSTPAKLRMDWAVKLDKPAFVGKAALVRMSSIRLERQLVALRFTGETPAEGTPLWADGRQVGHLTSSRYSPVLEYPVGLGFVTRVAGSFPPAVTAGEVGRLGAAAGTVVSRAFYDPEGNRVRG
jgi:sarcosine oxidase subunit alpha